MPRPVALLLLLACATTASCGSATASGTPESDADCVVFLDKCNSGCSMVCDTQRAKAEVERGEQCDLGCDVIDSGEEVVVPTDDDCVLDAATETCVWAAP